MIVEIFEKSIKPPGLEEAIDEVFDKIGLPPPNMDDHGFSSREGGFNILLNQYSSVIKIFPNLKEDDGDEYDEEGVSYIQGHQYHSKSIPPIGIVDMGDFTLALMPGVRHGKNSEFSEEEFDATGNALWKDIFNDDFGELNSAELNGELMSLDTIYEIDLEAYSNYEEKGLIDPLLEVHSKFEALQQSFYDAWTGKKDFSEFWGDMSQSKKDGLLIDGWNNSPHSSEFDKKGNIVTLAKNYEVAVQKHLEQNSFQEMVLD